MTLDVKEYQYIRDFVQKRSAIVLDEEKHYLIESRLLPVARQEGCASVGELVARMQSTPIESLRQRVIEAMTTHETSFFRDMRPFDAIRRMVIPERIAANQSRRQLKIACLACSTGQEPYSMAMMLRDNFPELLTWDVKIFATDLSTQILEKARTGAFSQLEVNRGLPAPYLLKYFVRQGMNWQMNDDVRSLIEFKTMNLIENWTKFPPIDLVFLRNVLIYFDIPTKKDILARVRRIMHPDGYLLLGGAETTLNLDDTFKRVELEKSSFYRLH